MECALSHILLINGSTISSRSIAFLNGRMPPAQSGTMHQWMQRKDTMRITFRITDAYRAAQLIETGKHLESRVTKAIPLDVISANSRRIITVLQPSLPDEFNASIPSLLSQKKPGYDSGWINWESNLIPTTPEEWDEVLSAYFHSYKTNEEENQMVLQHELESIIQTTKEALEQDLYDSKHLNAITEEASYSPDNYKKISSKYKGCSRYDEAVTLFKEFLTNYLTIKETENRIKEEEAQRQKDEEKAAQEKRIQERTDWINAHGSTELKKYNTARYDCKRMYVFERAALEYPGYLVDYKYNAKWEPIACPKDNLFQEAERVGGRVVYLTKWPYSDTDDDYDLPEYAKVQAVVVNDFLEQYDLVLPDDQKTDRY